MKQSMKWIVAVAVIALATTAAVSRSQEPNISQIMQRKLDHAHAILEALIRMWPCERMRVADRGLREGILATLMLEDGVYRSRRRSGRRRQR